jgi:predicted GNAT family N-acyltransferase
MTTYAVRAIPGEGRLADAHAVRRAVFVEEQGVSEAIEMDGNDAEATHVVVHDRAEGTPVATARLRTPEGVAKAERVAVRAAYRGRGLGARVMALLESAARRQGHGRVVLHAQTTVEGFYERLGYETTSDVFEEAGIPHVEMVKEL